MVKTSLKGLFMSAVAVGTVFALGLNEANAYRGWGSSSSGSSSSGSSSSSSGSWGSRSASSGSSSSGSWGRHKSRSWGSSSSSSGSSSSSSGSWGSHKRHRRAWGSSSSGSSSSGSSSSGSSGSSSSGGTYAPAAPAVTTWRTPSRSATLAVQVPVDAKVVVNKNETKSTGTDRRYVSNGLQPGRTYTYTIEATFDRDGKSVTELKTVQMTAGAVTNVVFGDSQSEQPATTVAKPSETKLTVKVPAEAKVFLAGSPTRMNGDVRTYTTTKLAAGESWANYTVRVELNQGGKTLTQEKTITLVAGRDQELAFDFETDKVASR